MHLTAASSIRDTRRHPKQRSKSRLTAHDSHVPQTNVKYESVVYIFTIISKNSNNNNIFSNSNNVNREWLNSHPTGLCNADHGLSN